MKNNEGIGAFLGVVILLACPLAGAQEPQGASSTATQQAAAQKPPAKPHKTWTDDDVSSLRTPADSYLREKDEQAAVAAAKQSEEAQAAKQAAAKPSVQEGGPPALSNPKSMDDADRMIDWENRDLEAQQEAVDRTRQELSEASPEEKAQKQKVLEHYLKCLEQVKQEKLALLKQRSELEKKAKESPNSAALQPPTS